MFLYIFEIKCSILEITGTQADSKFTSGHHPVNVICKTPTLQPAENDSLYFVQVV